MPVSAPGVGDRIVAIDDIDGDGIGDFAATATGDRRWTNSIS